MLGKVDLVMGGFSKTFASNGGFVASKNRAVKEYLRFSSPSCTLSNALSPVQAATVLKAFEIVDSEEGGALRRDLMRHVLNLRESLRQVGFELYGDPSAIVCVKMGSEALPGSSVDGCRTTAWSPIWWNSRRFPRVRPASGSRSWPATATPTWRMPCNASGPHSTRRGPSWMSMGAPWRRPPPSRAGASWDRANRRIGAGHAGRRISSGASFGSCSLGASARCARRGHATQVRLQRRHRRPGMPAQGACSSASSGWRSDGLSASSGRRAVSAGASGSIVNEVHHQS